MAISEEQVPVSDEVKEAEKMHGAEDLFSYIKPLFDKEVAEYLAEQAQDPDKRDELGNIDLTRLSPGVQAVINGISKLYAEIYEFDLPEDEPDPDPERVIRGLSFLESQLANAGKTLGLTRAIKDAFDQDLSKIHPSIKKLGLAAAEVSDEFGLEPRR